MLSERVTTTAAGVKGLITWKRFRASFRTTEAADALVRRGARLRCRGRRNYAINPRLYRRRDSTGPHPNGDRVFFKRSHWSRETWGDA